MDAKVAGISSNSRPRCYSSIPKMRCTKRSSRNANSPNGFANAGSSAEGTKTKNLHRFTLNENLMRNVERGEMERREVERADAESVVRNDCVESEDGDNSDRNGWCAPNCEEQICSRSSGIPYNTSSLRNIYPKPDVPLNIMPYEISMVEKRHNNIPNVTSPTNQNYSICESDIPLPGDNSDSFRLNNSPPSRKPNKLATKVLLRPNSVCNVQCPIRTKSRHRLGYFSVKKKSKFCSKNFVAFDLSRQQNYSCSQSVIENRFKKTSDIDVQKLLTETASSSDIETDEDIIQGYETPGFPCACLNKSNSLQFNQAEGFVEPQRRNLEPQSNFLEPQRGLLEPQRNFLGPQRSCLESQQNDLHCSCSQEIAMRSSPIGLDALFKTPREQNSDTLERTLYEVIGNDSHIAEKLRMNGAPKFDSRFRNVRSKESDGNESKICECVSRSSFDKELRKRRSDAVTDIFKNDEVNSTITQSSMADSFSTAVKYNDVASSATYCQRRTSFSVKRCECDGRKCYRLDELHESITNMQSEIKELLAILPATQRPNSNRLIKEIEKLKQLYDECQRYEMRRNMQFRKLQNDIKEMHGKIDELTKVNQGPSYVKYLVVFPLLSILTVFTLTCLTDLKRN